MSEQIVETLLADLANKRAKKEEDEYNFFFSAPPEVQQSYYESWRRSHSTDNVPMPRFLVDYKKASIMNEKS